MTKRPAMRPNVTLKLATSLDGRIATLSGQSQWITGPEARRLVHHMRADHDCVLTGIGTILADDPVLTARTDPPQTRQPVRAVLDSNLKTPAKSRLLATALSGKICLIHGTGWSRAEPVEHPNISRCYIDRLKGESGGLDLRQALAVLHASFGVRSVMVEAGSRLAGSFLRAGLVDKIVWFRAPLIIGGDGLSVFASLGVVDLLQALALDRVDISACGQDIVETYAIKRPL